MEKDNLKSIGEAIRDLLKTYRINRKYDETAIIDSWERLVGKPIAKRTRKIQIRNEVLFVEFDSPSLKHDFSFHKAKVLEIFQQEFGKDQVKEIVVM